LLQKNEIAMVTERRSTPRHKSFIRGRVLFNHRRSSMDCIIREFTKSGARLEFSEAPVLPEAFEVHVPSKDEYFQAHAIWHKGHDIGIAWAPEEVPLSPPESHRSADPLRDRVTKLEHEVAMIRKRLDALQG
jgi:hypothetical protein